MDIVIVTLPALLRDILVALLNARLRLNILAEFDHRPNPAQLLGLQAHCLLLGLRPGEAPQAARTWFAAPPSQGLVAISHDGRDAYLSDASGGTVELRNVSAATLAAAIIGRWDLDP
jgi:hypothetical protein